MNVAVLSIDYKSAPMSLLGQLTANKDDITHYVSAMVGTVFFEEVVVISTCNRIEWVFTSSDYRASLQVLFSLIHNKTGVDEVSLRRASNIYAYRHAVRHLFDVVCGLKSMVIGESEILTQVKQAMLFCQECGATKSTLNKLFQTVIATGKEVRASTKISSGPQSVSSIAIESIRCHNPDFLTQPMLLIGAGVMVRRAVAKLSSMGHQSLFITNRTMGRLQAITDMVESISVVPFATIRQTLHRFRTLYVAVSTKDTLIKASDVACLTSPQTMVDLGVPQTIDPACHDLDHIHLIGMADLELVSNQTIQIRKNDIDLVEQFIDLATLELNRWQSYRSQMHSCPAVQYA